MRQSCVRIVSMASPGQHPYMLFVSAANCAALVQLSCLLLTSSSASWAMNSCGSVIQCAHARVCTSASVLRQLVCALL